MVQMGPILGGDQIIHMYVDLEGFPPYSSALLGLVSYNDPCLHHCMSTLSISPAKSRSNLIQLGKTSTDSTDVF